MGDSGDGSEIIPIKVMLQDRCLPFGSPSPDSVWFLSHPAFIDKHYGSALVAGFFLSPAM